MYEMEVIRLQEFEVPKIVDSRNLSVDSVQLIGYWLELSVAAPSGEKAPKFRVISTTYQQSFENCKFAARKIHS